MIAIPAIFLLVLACVPFAFRISLIAIDWFDKNNSGRISTISETSIPTKKRTKLVLVVASAYGALLVGDCAWLVHLIVIRLGVDAKIFILVGIICVAITAYFVYMLIWQFSYYRREFPLPTTPYSPDSKEWVDRQNKIADSFPKILNQWAKIGCLVGIPFLVAWLVLVYLLNK